MKKSFRLFAAGMLLFSVSAYSAVLLSEDFEAGQTVGTQPVGVSVLRPVDNTAGYYVEVVGSPTNTAGSGNGIRIVDDASASGEACIVAYNFVSGTAEQVSAVRAEFSFARVSAGSAGDYIPIGIGAYNTALSLNSAAGRFIDARLYDDNRLYIRTPEQGFYTSLNATSNRLVIFVNDYDSQSVDYSGPDSLTYTLPSNSVAYWLNGSLLTINGAEYGTLDNETTAGGTVLTTEDNLGKFGFITGSTDIGLDYVFDDIQVSTITTNGSGGGTTNTVPEGLIEILSEDYETGQVVGDAPTGASVLRPLANTADTYTVIVTGSTNTAGEGNAVHLYDNGTVEGNVLSYNFVASANDQLSAVRVDFSFSALSAAGVGDDYLVAALGEYNSDKTLNAAAARFTEMRLYNDGTVDFRNVDLGQPYSLNNAILPGTNTVSIIANDSDTASITYTGLDSNTYTLPANSVAYWLNGSLVVMTGGAQYTALDLADPTDGGAGTVGTTDLNLGKFGFNSGTSDINLDWVIDNIKIYKFETGAPELHVHNLFQDHMMLQRNISDPIWGTATTGATVNVYLDDALIGSDTADGSGDWMVQMPSHDADGGVSHTLKISVDGAPEIVLSDVIYGDVYLCSGQSNMAFFMVNITNYDAISSTLTNALIRHVNVARAYSETLLAEPGSYLYNWERGDDLNNVRHFTAIGYLTALEIQKETGVPIGLLHSSYGGMEINMFLNPESLELVPELSGLAADFAQGGATDLYDIYNAMIGPLVPYGICGMLWYQGESDRDKPGIYEQKMLGLIRGWRAAWNLGNLPFYYVQLPNYAPDDQDYPKIREAQLNVLPEPNCGMAVTIDVGDDTNIHPTNKQDPSYRLAQWALAGKYGQDVAFSGPVVYNVEQEGSQLRVLFDYVESGLMIGQKIGTNPVIEVTSGELENFEIAGADGIFTAATAVIDFDSVVVSAPSVASPQYVRYCYDEAPSGLNKLYNRDGFPASPFRTDESCDLKIINGTGTQEAVIPGTVVAIAANTPASGKIFDRWIGAVDAVANVNSSSTTITMPHHGVYLTATYRDSGAGTNTLTVISGTGSSFAQAGAMVMIKAAAAPEGQVFSAWTGDTSALVDPSAENTTVIMPAADVTVTATYTTAPAVNPADLTVSDFTVTGGGVGFSFPNSSGYRYEVASTTDLVSGIWETRIYNLQGNDRPETVLFPNDTDAVRFYRIRVKQ